VQGKAERVTDLLPLLQDFYRDKLASLLRHQAGARYVGQYDFNNTYQDIINREEAHLSWVGKAIVDLGGNVDDTGVEPDIQAVGKGDSAAGHIIEADAHDAQQFVDRWRGRVEAMTNARHRGMLRVILGETLEQKRFFEQALAGQTDLLGRRPDHVGARVGHVLATRWIE
jgi:rubrerythrin